MADLAEALKAASAVAKAMETPEAVEEAEEDFDA